LVDLGVDGRIKLKCISKKDIEGIDGLNWLRIGCSEDSNEPSGSIK
jgi:hypothetical protein